MTFSTVLDSTTQRHAEVIKERLQAPMAKSWQREMTDA
jgi:hypothetical protein